MGAQPAAQHRHLADPDRAIIGGVSRRLALITVGSLVALVVVMLAIVFVTTRSAMEQSLRDTLATRAAINAPQLAESVRPDADSHDRLREATESELTLGGVFITVANPRLQLVGTATTLFNGKLPDPTAAREVLATHRQQYTTCKSPGGARFLILTTVLADEGATVGVAQFGVSMRQYDDSVNDVLRQLLMASAVGVLASAAITFLVVGRALQPIRRALRRQRDFVADAAHELRTPVAILRTAAELGLESSEISEQQSSLEQALAESVHLARLVDDLALLANADSGAMSLEPRPIDLAELVATAVSGIELLAEDREVRLVLEAPDTLPLIGDPVRLRQLLLILLDNALKHTPAGGCISVRLSRHGGKATLQVEDTGRGIDPDDLPQLFERFYRAARDRRIEGGGLGLAIGRWIAQAHGGQIKAANAAPHGAVFTVTLPTA